MRRKTRGDQKVSFVKCPYGGNCVWAGHTEVVGGLNLAMLHFNSEALPIVGSSEAPELFGHRLRTLITRATVEDSTASLGQKPSVRDVL